MQAESKPDFEVRILTLAQQGFALWGLLDFSSNPKAPATYRVWLKHKSQPAHIHGVGWGATPTLALDNALAAHEKEILRDRAKPTAPRAFTLDDLDLFS